MACINRNHPDLVEMAEELNVSPAVLAGEMGAYMAKNNIEDRFPTIEEMMETNKFEKVSSFEDKLENLKGSKKNQLDWYDSEKTPTVVEDSIDYSAKNNYTLFGNQQDKITANEILNNIINNSEDLSDLGKEFIQKAGNLVNKSGVKVQFVNESVFSTDDTIMDYDADNNTIRISRSRLSQYDTQQVVGAFLHEVAHSQTAKALLNPSTPEEKQFNDIISKMFSKYKQSSNGSESYGFENEMEFVAELYMNPDFRNEIENSDKSLWNKFIDSLRRLFGLKKNSEYDNLINDIVKNVESKNTEFKGIRGSNIFAKREDYKKTKVETIEERLNTTLDKVKDNLDQLVKRSKTYKKQNEEKGTKFETHVKELIDEIETAEKVSQWKSITVYLKSMSKVLSDLNKRVDSEDLTKENGLELLDSFKTYLSSYDLIDDVEKLVTSLEKDKIDEIGKDDIDELTNTLKEVKGNHSFLEGRFNKKLKSILQTQLNDIHYLPQVEEKWVNKLNKEYKDKDIASVSQTQWVSQQMNGPRKAEIQIDVDNEIDKLLNGIGSDISSASAMLMDGINNNSRLVSIATKLITNARENIIEKTLDGDFKEKELHDKFIKEKGNISNQKELYKNLIDYDSEGNGYYKGEYDIKFLNEFKKLNDTRNAIFKEKGVDSIEYSKANAKFKKFRRENTTFKNKVRTPLAKWKTDYSKLSKTEKEVLKYFIDSTKKTDEQTFGIQSLIEKAGGAEFYQLPSVTKSDKERLLEGNVKGLVKDKIKDFTSIRPDDIGYEEKRVNSKHEIVNYQKVHYRGQIEPDQQSYDLFTVNRLNRINGTNYEEKHKVALQLEAIKEISKNKDYYLETTNGKQIKNAFGIRQTDVLKKGVNSNEYKFLQSVIEKNLYDILNVNYGQLGPVDVNKAISTFNGWTASVGLSLNAFSAAANILNAQAQIFLEKVAGNHITKGAIKEAHAVYSKDLPSIMKDFNQPIKTSFVNQVNQMFDTFGGFTVKQQEFLKNSIAKTAIDMESLQFMHEGGEHYAQSVMVMATLVSIKVMNSNNEFIDVNGNIVSEDKAANLLKMLKKDENGRLRMDDKVVFTTRNLTTKMNKGGKEQIMLFVKKKIFDTMGNYDSNFQNEAYRHWYGKLFMMFRRYLIPQLVNRYRGLSTAFVKEEDLTEDNIHFNDALRTSEEGSYVSLLRFLRHGAYPALRQLKFDIISSNWDELSDDKKAGIKKSITEIAITSTLLPLLAMLSSGAAGDDDDSWLWTIAYLTRRLESELSQFRDPREATKITKSPIPSLRMIEMTLNTLDYVLPWNWSEINDKYEAGKHKGDLKIVNTFTKLSGINKFDNKSKELYDFMNSNWGKGK